MARMITNYEKYKEDILELIAGNPSAVGCIFQVLTGGSCDPSTSCDQCASLLNIFLQQEAEHPLSEKEIVFCRIMETGYIERRKDGHLWLIKDEGNGYSIPSDITFLELFEWLEVSDRRFDIRGYLNSHE